MYSIYIRVQWIARVSKFPLKMLHPREIYQTEKPRFSRVSQLKFKSRIWLIL